MNVTFSFHRGMLVGSLLRGGLLWGDRAVLRRLFSSARYHNNIPFSGEYVEYLFQKRVRDDC